MSDCFGQLVHSFRPSFPTPILCAFDWPAALPGVVPSLTFLVRGRSRGYTSSFLPSEGSFGPSVLAGGSDGRLGLFFAGVLQLPRGFSSFAGEGPRLLHQPAR